MYIKLTVTQSDLIKNISKAEGIEESTVRKIFRSAESFIFEYLSSATQSKSIEVHPLSGVKIESGYREFLSNNISNDSIGARIWSKAKISRYYNRKINELKGD